MPFASEPFFHRAALFCDGTFEPRFLIFCAFFLFALKHVSRFFSTYYLILSTSPPFDRHPQYQYNRFAITQ